MKKLLFLIPLIPFLLHAADTITSGSIGLLKPSITTADPTRGAGDKTNGNWDMVAATFTKIIIQITGLSTSTVLLPSTNTWTGSNTFKDITVGTLTAISSVSTFALSVSSFSMQQGTWTVGNVSMILQTTAPVVNTDYTMHLLNGRQYWGGDAGAGTTPPAPVGNSTKTMDITLGGGMVLSTITIYGLPGTTRSPGKSSWTILDEWADCALGSTVGIFGFNLAYSSSQYGAPFSLLFPRMDVSTQSVGGLSNNIATSQFYSSSSFIGAHTYLGVQVATMPASGANGQDCHVHYYYWEANKYSP